MRYEPQLAYSVWAADQTYAEEPAQTKCMARFRFFQEALDYAEYVRRNGVPCIVQGAARYVSEFKPGDERHGSDCTGYTGRPFVTAA
jgi:hypothetical protein